MEEEKRDGNRIRDRENKQKQKFPSELSELKRKQINGMYPAIKINES